MVLQCLHYNNTGPKCKGAYLECAKQVDCSDFGHCFVVWLDHGTTNEVLGAGCNPTHPSSTDICADECLGKKKRAKSHYCCCKGNLCNTNFTKLIQKPDDLVSSVQGLDPEAFTTTNTTTTNPNTTTNTTTNVLWSVIPIILIITLVGIYIYWFKRGTNKNHNHHSIKNGHNTNGNESNQNRRNKGVSGNLNDRELNELRNNNDISILIPFRNNFGVDHIFNNNNHHTDNHDHNQQRTLTNHRPNNHDNVNNNQQGYVRHDLSSIKLLEIIGSGRFGTVHRASLGDSNSSEIAVKIISAIEHHTWVNEQQIYRSPRVKHENILNFLYSDEHLETGTYWLVVEYASKGSLYSFLKDNVVTWKEFLYIALGIVRGLSHLHEADIAHRDFKSKNVLLRHDLTPCVTDFGVAAILDTNIGSQHDHRKKYLQVGTPRYMAPEVLECSVTFTKASFTKIDVYALSLVLWELISRCKALFKQSDRSNTSNSSHPTNHRNLSEVTTAGISESNASYKSSSQALLAQHDITQRPESPRSRNPSEGQPDESTTQKTPRVESTKELNTVGGGGSGDTNERGMKESDDSGDKHETDESEDAQELEHLTKGYEKVHEHEQEQNQEREQDGEREEDQEQEHEEDDDVPPYKLPFEDLAGPSPDISKMRQIVVVEKMRPILRNEWRIYPASEFSRAIEDGWEYDHDARISASCFVERVESLPQFI